MPRMNTTLRPCRLKKRSRTTSAARICIAKDQIRTIHLLHENFARSMASSLSAYLRSYVVVNLISVEQLAFVEFTQSLPSPTCIVAMSMKPYDSSAVLEMNPSLVFPLLEMLLGGSAKSPKKMDREITEIEQSILDGLLRVILHDLESAWTAIAPMQFTIDNHETEPQLLQVFLLRTKPWSRSASKFASAKTPG